MEISGVENLGQPSIIKFQLSPALMSKTLGQSSMYTTTHLNASVSIPNYSSKAVKRKTHNAKNLKDEEEDDYEKKQKKPSNTEKEENFANIRSNVATTLPDVGQNFKSKFKEYRVKNLVSHFIAKLRRVSIYRTPVDYDPFESKIIRDNAKGLNFHKYLLNLFYLGSILFSLSNLLLSTFILAFPLDFNQESMNNFNILTIIWMVFQIFLGFLLQRKEGTTKLTSIRDISLSYAKSQFIFDLFFLTVVILREFPNYDNHEVIELLIFFKLKDVLKKMKMLEIIAMEVTYQEQFWSLLKMFLTNLFLFHCIAITLILTSKLNQQKNWLISKGLPNAAWWQQYGWSFYWATTTMLTVGFGDIVPTNLKEASVLVVIEVFSCMTLAYNINLMGKILEQMQKNNVEKHRNLKVLRQLVDEDKLDTDLEFKLLNHIKQSHKIKDKFNFDEKQTFVKNLPVNLKTDYLRQSNYKLLNRIFFFKNFTNKTVYKLAKKLNDKMAHPWEIVTYPSSDEIIVLREGTIGLVPNFSSRLHRQVAIDKIQSVRNCSESLISLNFAKRRYTVQNYQLKSIGYSIIKWFSKNDFLDVLRERPQDIQFFIGLQDKERKEGESYFSIFKCLLCKQNHSKMQCPHLHYIPISQKIVNTYIAHVNRSRSDRKSGFVRQQKEKKNCLCLYKSFYEYTTQQNIRITEDDNFDSPFFIRNNDSSKSFRKISLNIYPCNVLKESFKNENQGTIETSKNQEIQLWTNEFDKAHDFQFYFATYNPKNLSKNLQKKSLTKKYSSLNRLKTLVKKSTTNH